MKKRRSRRRTKRISVCCDHEWVVFSTVIGDGLLMVQCVKCGAHGTVDDPTREEWGEAFHAPSKPYRWLDSSRVHVRHRGNGEFYVVRAEAGPRCSCPHEASDSDGGEYVRVWVELIHGTSTPTEEERRDLAELSKLVERGELCSHLFPVFLEHFQQDTGHEPSGAARGLARRMEGLGVHFSPRVVARLLHEYSRRGR